MGRVWSAQPWVVVEDGDELLATYMRPGTTWYMPPLEGPLGHRLHKLSTGKWDLLPFEWEKNSVLRLQRSGSAHSVWLLWGPSGEFLYTYVSLERPAARTPIGIDTMDHTLDIVVSAEGRSWKWKDEIPFAGLELMGIMTPAESSSIRQEGERVVELIERGDAWWTEWRDWVPDPDWPIPALPEGWDAV